MTTLISQIYNEEFLLPFFIEHHYEKFENGIIVDYGSTDASLSIIAKLAPKWRIVDCSGENFSATKVDALIHSIEEACDDICLALTATEFFVGDPRFITKEMVVPCYSLLRLKDDPEIKVGQKFHEVYRAGVSPFQVFNQADTEWLARLKGRKISTTKKKYPTGRHFEVLGQTPFLIYRVANCLASEEMITRRLQIQKRIPISDIESGFGVQHTNYGKGLDLDSLLDSIERELLVSEDVSIRIESALQLESYLKTLETDSKTFNIMKGLITQFELNQIFIDGLVGKNLMLASKLLANQIDLEIMRKELIDEIVHLETQSKRPIHNLTLFISNVYPAIKVRLRTLFK